MILCRFRSMPLRPFHSRGGTGVLAETMACLEHFHLPHRQQRENAARRCSVYHHDSTSQLQLQKTKLENACPFTPRFFLQSLCSVSEWVKIKRERETIENVRIFSATIHYQLWQREKTVKKNSSGGDKKKVKIFQFFFSWSIGWSTSTRWTVWTKSCISSSFFSPSASFNRTTLCNINWFQLKWVEAITLLLIFDRIFEFMAKFTDKESKRGRGREKWKKEKKMNVNKRCCSICCSLRSNMLSVEARCTNYTNRTSTSCASRCETQNSMAINIHDVCDSI